MKNDDDAKLKNEKTRSKTLAYSHGEMGGS
jgi:hypothetical protein